jgi:hypothetical protein
MMIKEQIDELRKFNAKRRAEMIDFCIAVANAHLTHINCQECKAPNELHEYYFSGLVKVECSNCHEELDLAKLINVKPNPEFMKWSSKRVPRGDEDRIIRNNEREDTPTDISSLIEGIQDWTQPDGTVDFSAYKENGEWMKCKKKRMKPKLDSRLTQKPDEGKSPNYEITFELDPPENDGGWGE